MDKTHIFSYGIKISNWKKNIYIISPIVGLLRENLSFILSIGRERYIMVRLAL